MPTLAVNKRARFDYEIADTYEAGMVLFGHEVKSVKTGHVSMKGAFVTTRRIEGRPIPEIYLTNAHIPKYKQAAGVDNYDPDRPRKLLMHKKQIEHLVGKKKEQGLTLVPIKIYTKHNLVKLEFGIGRGKKKYDKRESIKKRDVDRKVRTLTKQRVR